MGKVYMNVIRQGDHILVAACDAELLGRTLRDKGIVFKVQERFYGGSLACVEDVMEAIKRATCANLIGPATVGAAVKEGFIHPESVMLISGIPHAIIVRM